MSKPKNYGEVLASMRLHTNLMDFQTIKCFKNDQNNDERHVNLMKFYKMLYGNGSDTDKNEIL